MIPALLSLPRMRPAALLSVLFPRIKELELKKVYRVYVTDALRIITENTARIAGGKSITARYADIIEEKKPDTRTAEEIAGDVITRGGLVRKGGETT